MRRLLLPALLLVPALALAACGSDSSSAASSSPASSTSASASGSPSPGRSPDATTFCRSAQSLYGVMQTATNAAEASRGLTTLAAALRASAPAEVEVSAKGFAMGLDAVANGISSGTLDGSTATVRLESLVKSSDGVAMATYCADKGTPSASASGSPSPSAT